MTFEEQFGKLSVLQAAALKIALMHVKQETS